LWSGVLSYNLLRRMHQHSVHCRAMSKTRVSFTT
jgi:hypothetical protein